MYEREKERYEREMRNYKPKPEPGCEASAATASELCTPSTTELINTSVKEELDV